MKKHLFVVVVLLVNSINAQFTVTKVGELPVKVSNNAVCEGFINEVPYLFSFAGIDSTKIYSGIHLQSFRCNFETKKTIQIPDLPDTRGKIACAANRIDDIIYISGGYHVFKDGHEVSSNKMHRYDIVNNIFLEDGAPIPIATDDHVQAVWKNTLIYIISGWSNKENIPNVQIYNPKTDIWLNGTSTPNTSAYKSFGASGTIIGNTIYYFGGATSDKGFAIQNQLRIGKINPNNPTEIKWSIIETKYTGYRMTCTTVDNKIHWLGGSNNTYNFNGIAYDKSGGVPTNNRDLFLSTSKFEFFENFVTEIPMDLRGIANIKPKIKYIAGGMLSNQKVTRNIYKLEWK